MTSILRRTRAYRPLSRATLLAGLVLASLAPGAVSSQQREAPFTLRESGRGFASLQAAVDAVGDGSATIEIGPGTIRQCAVQQQGSIAYVARQPGTAVFDGVACEGKAALVLRGRRAELSGLTFRNLRVPDGNGAGVRLERGDLAIRQTWFADSQQGILTADDPGSAITIDRTTFSGLGTCEHSAGCAHSIYVGDYGLLQVTRSRFERGTGGHYLKSRSARVEITGNSFDDSAGRATNYMIDLPAGATGRIEGNWFVQGRDKENYSAFIALGAETLLHPSAGLAIAGNHARFVPGLRRSSAFVADWTEEKLAIGANQLAPGIARFEAR